MSHPIKWIRVGLRSFGAMEELVRKWRLVLGQKADPGQEVEVSGELRGMDQVLEDLYGADEDRRGGLGGSSPKINRWLGDIRRYFPTEVVQLLQRDALDRLGLDQMLLEPELLEAVTPDVHLVATLLSLKKLLPEQTRDTARRVVEKVVKELEEQLRLPLEQAVRGALRQSERNRRPKHTEIDWHQTIRINLKHYQEDLGTVIPEQLRGHGRRGQSLKHVILLVDQSGSMAPSVVYASVCGAILASVRSLKTHFIAFDTAVVDLTADLHDPVDLLFGTQLGGGTDIGKALGYAIPLIQQPQDTIVVLLSDMYEGGNVAVLLQRAARIVGTGATLIGLLALSDEGKPAYDKRTAEQLQALGVPVFGCTPGKFADVMARALRGEQVQA